MTLHNYDHPLTKYCRRCKTVKPASEFGTNMRNRDGMKSYCKPCNTAYKRDWSKRHPNYDRDRMRRTRARKKASRNVNY